MTNDTETRPGPLPADPVAYDSPRARIARAKGLEAPYIAGGKDPDPEPGLREERYYGRLLVCDGRRPHPRPGSSSASCSSSRRAAPRRDPGRRRRRSGSTPRPGTAATDELVETLRDLIRIRVGQSAAGPGARWRAPRRAPDRGHPAGRRARARGRRAGARARLGPCPPARRRHRRRATPAALAPRRGPGAGRALDARPVRGRPRRRLRLRARRGRHEGDGRDGAGRRRAPRRRGPRGRPRSRPRPDPGAPPRRPVHVHRGRGGRRTGRRQMGRRESPGVAAGRRARSTSAAACR